MLRHKVQWLTLMLVLVGALAFASGAQQTPAALSDEVTTFTVRNIAPGQEWQLSATPVGQVIVERTNTDIRWETTIGDENQAVALLIASGDLPDAVVYRAALGAAPFVEGDIALELTDLIRNHAPNYLEALGSNWDRMAWSAEDPGRYIVAQLPSFGREQFAHHGWFFLQHDVVMSQGYPQMETLDDYERAIKTYLRENPTIDGQPTIGMTLVADDWRWIISLTNPGMMAAGIESSGEIFVDPDTREVTYRVLRPEERAYYRWLNRMWNDGVLDRDAFTQTNDQFEAKMASGRVLAATAMRWQFGQSEASLRQRGLLNRMYGEYPISLDTDTPNSSMSGGQAWDIASGTMIITTQNRNPQKFMEFIDFLVSDEGQILRNWGIEGVHYDVVDGRREFRHEERERLQSDPDYALKTGVGLLGASWPRWTDGIQDPTGQYYTLSSPEDIVAGYTDLETEVLAEYGVTRWAELFPQPADFPVRPWPAESSIVNFLSQDYRVIFQRLQDTIKRDVIAAIVGPINQFDANWERFVQNMERAGVRRFEAEIERLNAEFLELWGQS